MYVHKNKQLHIFSASGLMKTKDQENHHFYALTYHIGLANHGMKTMTFLMKMVLPNIWKQDDVVITRIILRHLMTNIHVHILGNIVWKVKNVFLKDGIVPKKNVRMTKNISIATNHKNAYLDNGFVMELFNVLLLQKMKHLNFVRHEQHSHREPQYNVQKA